MSKPSKEEISRIDYVIRELEKFKEGEIGIHDLQSLPYTINSIVRARII